MTARQRQLGFVFGGFAIVCLCACGPDPGAGQRASGIGGAAGNSAADASLGNGSTPGLGEAGFATFVGDGSVRNTRPTTTDASCGAVSQTPEEIIVYRDATVTDTIVDVITDTFTDTIRTLEPVALFIMQDRSGSMVTGFPPPASPDSWNNSAAAITAFVNDPASQGLDVGLGTFPVGANNTAACDGTDCGQPVVPIARLPGNAAAMAAAMQQQAPSNPVALTPTECGLRGMINQCLTFTARTGEKCVTVLVTDGTPTQCDANQQNLIAIVASGYARGILTYTIGLPGSDAAFLTALSQAGGTNASLDVSQGPQAFIAALNGIRETVTSTVSSTVSTPVSHTVSSTVTTQTTIATKLDCQWKIPEPKEGGKFDPAKVNLQLTTREGVMTPYGHVDSQAQCAQSGDGWYYDDAANPTEVVVCPQTCDTLKAVTGARIDLMFGCETVDAILK